MTRSWTGLVLALAAVYATGCYTVLRAPGGFFTPEEAPAKSTAWAPEDRDLRIGKFSDDRDREYAPYDAYGSGYPIFGYDSRYGMYGFGSPFAYGPGYGYGYGSPGYGGYGGYNPYYGPYGYGYDPYYSGQVYVPPGYELVTSRELADLRSGSGSVSDPTSAAPRVDQSAVMDQQRRSQERAWSQRTEPTVRRSTVEHRTTRTSSSSKSSGTVSSSGSSKPASEEKSSGSSEAKRRKKRR